MEQSQQSLKSQSLQASGNFILPLWASEAVAILRLIINDFDAPYKYTDDRLVKLLLAAGQLMQSELKFPQNYTIDVGASLLIPDPANPATRDDGFINLMVLKAACLLAGAGIIRGAEQSIDITDKGTRVNLSGRINGVVATIKNYCDAYNTAKWQYQSGLGAGQAVIGPYRIFLEGAYPELFGDRYIRGIF